MGGASAPSTFLYGKGMSPEGRSQYLEEIPLALSRSKVVDWGGLTLKVNNIELGCLRPNDGYAPASFPAVANGQLLCSQDDVGTVATTTTTTVQEYGFGPHHVSKFVLTSFAVGTSGDAAAKAIGAKFYTLPAGNIIVHRATLYGGVTAAISITTDTGEIGIGTVVGSGVAATLSSTMENIMDGGATVAGLGDAQATLPDMAGGLVFKTSLSTVSPIIKTSSGLSHDLYLNVAATWSDVTAAGAVTFTGNIILEWTKLS